jgi:hypothetical protein
MNTQNLFVKYTLAGDSRLHVKPAFRIVIDGKGGLLIYASENSRPETIELSGVESFSIHNVRTPREPAPAFAAWLHQAVFVF